MDKIFKISLKTSAFIIVLLLLLIFVTIIYNSTLSIREFGLNFLINKEWDPVNENFGAAPFIVGTLLTSILAILFSIPLSLAVALFLGEYASGKFAKIIRTAIELMAGIPSVIYGLWALFVIVPLVQQLQTYVGETPYGVGVFTASVVLAIMIIPYSASLSAEMIKLVPKDLKEAAYAMGATRFEVMRHIVLPYSFSGIAAGVMLAFGRALGETMAVTMVIGNSNEMPNSIFSLSNTMASVIANEYTEATADIYLSSLIEIALVLFVITAGINMMGKVVIKKYSVSC